MKTRLADLVIILETSGSNPENWPPAIRAEMEAFIASSAAARQALAEATELDRCLDTLREIKPAPDLAARILADLPPRPVERPRPPRRGAILALPLAAAAIFALWLGQSTTAPITSEAPEATASFNFEGEALVWEMPSDVLLNVASLDPVEDVPEFDCFYAEPGCFDSTENRESSLMLTSRNLT